MSDIVQRLRDGLDAGAVDLADIMDAADEIARLRFAIRRLADQDATLSVVGGNVIVTMDATLTGAEREAIEVCAMHWQTAPASDVLRRLLERTKVRY